MKYIKKYENLNKLNINNIKTYVVSNFKNNYYLDKLLNIGQQFRNDNALSFHFKTMCYQESDGTLNYNNRETSVSIDYIKSIIFTSDNYDEAFEFFNTKIQQTKYNL